MSRSTPKGTRSLEVIRSVLKMVLCYPTHSHIFLTLENLWFKALTWGLERWLSSKEHWLLFQRTWMLTPICNSSSRASDTLT